MEDKSNPREALKKALYKVEKRNIKKALRTCARAHRRLEQICISRKNKDKGKIDFQGSISNMLYRQS